MISIVNTNDIKRQMEAIYTHIWGSVYEERVNILQLTKEVLQQ